MASLVHETGTRRARLLIGGEWVEGTGTTPVFDKYSGASIGEVAHAGREHVTQAVVAAKRSFETVPLEPYDRYRILLRTAELIEARRQEFIPLIAAEAGFPVSDAANEVSRAAQTFIISAEEAKRLVGEVVPIESAPGHAHRLAFSIRVPRGVVCGITSFNSPLNMVAHKVAPALAAGNTVVLKPPQGTPFSAALLFELLLEAGLPPAHANLIQGAGSQVGRWLVENQDIRFYTFTGSTAVGRELQRSVGLRPITLELGSIAASIVCDDADLGRTATRVAASSFRRAGQMCTSTQKLFVDQRVLESFLPLFLSATRQLKVGDPRDPDTAVGPMISETDAIRAESWVQEAVALGARLLEGGRREGPVLRPTVLIDITPTMRVSCQELFAPVVSIIPFTSIETVVGEINSSPYGLATGLFTRDVTRALTMAKRIHVGIVHINEPSSSRADLMPFAGVKDSGLGREGPRYAMHEMTEERLITVSLS